MSLIDTLRALAITVRNEKKKEANSTIRIGDLFLAIIDFIKGLTTGQIRQEGVDTYNDTSGGKTSLLNTYPNPEQGWTVLVRKDETNAGKPTLYQWNGTRWVNLETPVYEEDIITKEDMDINVSENVLNDINSLKYSSITGEGLNGATISEDKKKITVPSGSTGNSSYFLAVFSDTELLKIISDAYIKNNDSVYAVLKYKISDDSISSQLTPRIQKDSSSTSIGIVSNTMDNNGYKYILFKITGDLSTLTTSIRIGLQFYPPTVMTQDFTFEYIDAAVFFIDNSEYSILLAEKVNEKKYISDYTFGSTKQAYTRFSNFRGGIACNNTPTAVGGIIESIYIKVNGTGGTMHFGPGIVDQRGWAIIREEFYVDVVTGSQTIDISDKNIPVNKDELLFVFLDDANAAPMFEPNSAEGNDIMLFNDSSPDEALMRLNTTYGGYLTLAWTVRGITSELFATKPELEKVNNDIKTVNESITQTNSRIGIFTDYLGNKYEARVVNGGFVPVPLKYIKALFIGNSITTHPIVSGIWWGLWGMAASKKEFDYVSIVERGLKLADNTAVASGYGVSDWERDFSVDKDTLFGNVLTSDLDLVVFRLGENVPIGNISNFESEFDSLLSYVITKCPSARFAITGVFWTNGEKDAILSNVAVKYGITFIKLSDFDRSENKIKVGDLVWGDDGLQHEITQASGVSGHPNDNGMKEIGNRILMSIGYETVE